MIDHNTEPTHVFEDGAKLYRRSGTITVEDKDGNLLPAHQVHEYARQYMNQGLAKMQERMEVNRENHPGRAAAPVIETTPAEAADQLPPADLDWDGLKESVKGSVRHETLMATVPEEAPPRVMDGLTHGIEVVRELTNVQIESHSQTADGIVTTFTGEADGMAVIHSVRELKQHAADANDERLVKKQQYHGGLDVSGRVREDGILTATRSYAPDEPIVVIPTTPSDQPVLQPFSQALGDAPRRGEIMISSQVMEGARPNQGKTMMMQRILEEQQFPGTEIVHIGRIEDLQPYQKEMIKDIEQHVKDKAGLVVLEDTDNTQKVSVDVETDSFDQSKGTPLISGAQTPPMSDDDIRGFLASTHAAIGGKTMVQEELAKAHDPSIPLVIGAGAGDGYGLDNVAKVLLDKTDANARKTLQQKFERVGTIGHVNRRDGFGAQAARLALAQAALGLVNGQGSAGAADNKLQDISVAEYNARKASLQTRMRNLFEPDDRKEAKRIFANFKPGKFGVVEHVTIFVPKGVFFGQDGGEATGASVIKWIRQLVGQRDLQALGRLVGGRVGYDIPWSWNVFSALAGRLMWDLVQRVPAATENIDKLPVSKHIDIMSAAIDQIVAAARSKK